MGWTVWWAVFPDVLAFGPSFAAGLWLRLAGGTPATPTHGHLLPHVHIGLPLYPAAHSLLVFALVFGLVSILARRIVFEIFGWLLHILIDIPTHSFSYYATRFLWPISEFRVNGIAWWTPLVLGHDVRGPCGYVPCAVAKGMVIAEAVVTRNGREAGRA